MNFFEILKYYSNLSENFTSSFIKYLLIPTEKHGLNYYVFESILQLLGDEILFRHVINKKDELIIPENEKNLGKNYGRIEISIEFSYRDQHENRAKKAIILIENKINEYSIKNEDKRGKKQIIRYLDYLASLNKVDYKRLIYLLPETVNLQELSEYYFHDIDTHPLNRSLTFLYWKHPQELEAHQIYNKYFLPKKSFISLFEKLIKDETKATIDPLDPHLLYLIKSFIHTVHNNFTFEVHDDTLIQKYSDFKSNLNAVDGALYKKLLEFEDVIKKTTGKPVLDSMSTRSKKIGIPVPQQYYKKEYKNPQFFFLLKEVITIEEQNYFPIVFEEYYFGTSHWDLQKVENYFKIARQKYQLNQNEGTLKVYISKDSDLQAVIDFDKLKSFRLDRRNSK